MNSTRKAVTKDCCDRFVKDKQSIEINFKYKSQIEKYKTCEGMPVICTQNMKPKSMFNMMEFTIDEIYDDKFVINGETFDKNEFRGSFLPNLCNTVYKYQGGKIDEHYNIWDTNRMYTSLSRTTKLEYIHLDNKKKCRWYRERQQDEMIMLNSYFNADYQNGKIYQITFENNNKIYVGCTTQLLEERLDEHCINTKLAIYKYRDDSPIIDLICIVHVKTKRRLKGSKQLYK